MLEQNRGWILKKAREMEALAEKSPLGMDRPGVVWFEGVPLEFDQIDGLKVNGPDPIASIGRWYRREARQLLAIVVDQESERLGAEPGKLSVRDQRTRWGSCSAKGDLSFSWRLILTPPEVLRYVVIHELCHLRELNHSKRFWELLDEAMPGWKAHADWLREHSYEIGAHAPRLS